MDSESNKSRAIINEQEINLIKGIQMSQRLTKTKQKATQAIQGQNEGLPIKLGSHMENNPMKTADPKANQESPLIYARVSNQALEATVHKLNTLTAGNWIGIARTIEAYIYHAASNSSERKDHYVELSSHKDCYYKDSHLRNFITCLNLWQKLGGKEGAPALSLSHYLLVTPGKISEFKKRTCLIYAKEHDLTASQFREYIEKEFKLIPNLTKGLGKSLIKLQERISDINCREIIKYDSEMTRTLKLTISQIFAQKLLSLEEFNSMKME